MTLKWTGLMPGETIHSQCRNVTPRCRGLSRRKGFALVITISLMILLTVIAVGLLTLSSISLRGSTQTQAQATARANATKPPDPSRAARCRRVTMTAKKGTASSPG